MHVISTLLSVEREYTLAFPQWVFTHIFPLWNPTQGHLHCLSSGLADRQLYLITSFWIAWGSDTPSLGDKCSWLYILWPWFWLSCNIFRHIYLPPLPQAVPRLTHLWLLVQFATCLQALVHVISNIQMRMKTILFQGVSKKSKGSFH